MNLPKDAYVYLTNFADDRTILSMLSTNKDFRDEQFFERVMRRKYPLLLEYRKNYNSWKDMFIKMTYYIAKLQEKYDFPYIPTEGYNPQNFYHLIKNQPHINIYNYGMTYATKGKHKELMDFFTAKGEEPVSIGIMPTQITESGLRGAAEGGHKDLVDFFIGEGAKDMEFGLNFAAKGGHKDLIDFFISKGAHNWDLAMKGAAEGGHKDLVEYFVAKGASDFNNGLYFAVLGGHKDLVDYFISKGANHWHSGLTAARTSGNNELFLFFRNKITKGR